MRDSLDDGNIQILTNHHIKIMNQNNEYESRSKQIRDYDSFLKELKDINIKKNIQKNTKQDNHKIQTYLKKYGFPFFFTVFMELQERRKKQLQSYLFRVSRKPQTLTSLEKQQSFDENSNSFYQLLHELKDQTNLSEVNIDFMRIYKQIKFATDMSREIISPPKTGKQMAIFISDERNKKFIKLTKEVFQTVRQIDLTKLFTDTTIKEKFLNSSASLIKIWPRNIYEEKTLNYLRQILEISYSKGMQNVIHCCSVFLRLKMTYLKQESKYHEHKNYHWPIQLATMVKHVKKTIVGFLNLDGGIIYVGMKQNLNNVQLAGILLTKDEVVKFFQWVHQLCETIYPSFSKEQSGQSQKMYKQDLEKLKNRENFEEKSQFAVNRYVAVEYLSIIDQTTHLDCYEESAEKIQEKNKRLYLIRIKIKPGTKFDTYHLLKDDNEKNGEIQCFMRKDTTVNKLSLDDFFRLYSERFIQFMNEEDRETIQTSCPKIHFDF